MLDCRVEHRDVQSPNVLLNAEIRNMVLVDFERSEILKQLPVLQETLPNQKRKNHHFDPNACRRSLSDGLFINPSKCFDNQRAWEEAFRKSAAAS